MDVGRKTSFKAGFLAKLAADGVRPSAVFERVKEAGKTSDPLTSYLGGIYGEGRRLTGAAVEQAVPAAKLLATIGIGAPLALGGAAGVLGAKLTSPPEPDIEAIRKAELIALYRKLTNEIRMRRRAVESGV